MKIILDAMGGDNAPEAPVLGAIEAAKAYGAQITLVGRGEAILAVLGKHGIADLPEGVEIANADDVVDMHDDPASVIHKRKNSSMIVGLKLLADGQGDAFVSAGSTGALLTGATLLVKRVKGIRRAAMAPAMPTKTGGKVIICDCGANAECTPEFLLQFGLVGSAYAKKSLKLENPRVGLLNIGTDDSKGTPLQKAAYALLKQYYLSCVADVARFVPETEALNETLELEQRFTGILDCPTIGELGYDNVKVPLWRGVCAPKSCSDEAYAYYCDVFSQMAQSDAWKTEYCEVYQAVPFALVGDEATEYMVNAQNEYLAKLGR